jgi:hypothetical protein
MGNGGNIGASSSAVSADNATRIVGGKFVMEKNGSVNRNALTRRKTISQLYKSISIISPKD